MFQLFKEKLYNKLDICRAPATKTVNTGFTVTLPYNAVGTITGGGENAFVSPMFRGIK